MLTTGKIPAALERNISGSLRTIIKPGLKAYRSGTSRLRALPDFVVVGARKCGTTALYTYLAEHPQVLPALKKEVLYFDTYFDRGESWYRSHFPSRVEMRLRERIAGCRIVTGEASPSYLYHPLVAPRLRTLVPDAKLLVILRDPVAAIYSAYQFGLLHKTYSRADHPFEPWMSRELDFLGRGGHPFVREDGILAINPSCAGIARHLYADLLEPWFACFPEEQIHVVLAESMKAAPDAVYQDTLAFLGLEPHRLRHYPRMNANAYEPMGSEIRERLEDFFQPHNDRLREMLGLELNWSTSRASALEVVA